MQHLMATTINAIGASVAVCAIIFIDANENCLFLTSIINGAIQSVDAISMAAAIGANGDT